MGLNGRLYAMNTYKAKVWLEIEIEAPDFNDAEEMIEDHYGLGSGGEGVDVVSIEYSIE